MDVDKIVVIGAGGTGSWLCPALARYLASIDFRGNLVIVDGDSYEATNISRQFFSVSFASGMNKAEYQAEKICSDLSEIPFSIEIIPSFVGKSEINSLVQENTVIFNCVDNSAARKFVEDRVSTLNNAIHICCGNELRTGQVQVCYRRDGKNITPSIYQRSPVFNSDNDDRSKMNCQELAALPGGGQIIAANFLAASLALNYFIQIFHDFKWNSEKNWVSSGTTSFDLGTGNFLILDKVEINV